jgi:Ribonuclease G/E
MLELNPPKGLGFIVRTAGTDRTTSEKYVRDYNLAGSDRAAAC